MFEEGVDLDQMLNIKKDPASSPQKLTRGKTFVTHGNDMFADGKIGGTLHAGTLRQSTVARIPDEDLPDPNADDITSVDPSSFDYGPSPRMRRDLVSTKSIGIMDIASLIRHDINEVY